MRDAGVMTGAALLVRDDVVVAVAPERELRDTNPDATVIECLGGVLTPGFVDSHTHAVFGRARFEEQELRAAGAGYMEIARQGGGIHSSVRDLRARNEDELFALAAPRLMRLAASGVTTVEVKSGYGLTLDDELKTLRVVRRLAEALPLRIVPTFLGAHEIPLEYRDSAVKRREYNTPWRWEIWAEGLLRSPRPTFTRVGSNETRQSGSEGPASNEVPKRRVTQ